MKKLFLLLMPVFLAIGTAAQNRLLDHPMQIKKFSMSVQADCFTATSFIEMEFYNPNDTEIEGLYRFTLEPNQVITAFQLDLNGKYRDGSIEEKWKARNAYNTIVGKRIDPALLTMEWANNYRLNIYPVPARSGRKITMTITQELKEENNKLVYRFQLNKADTASELEHSIKTMGCTQPITSGGMLNNHLFLKNKDSYELKKSGKHQSLGHPVVFYFPLKKAGSICTMQQNGLTYFATRTEHQVPASMELQPKKILVYWDVSGSSNKRNLAKETGFLKQYIQKHNIEELTFVIFGANSSNTMKFFPGKNKNWMNFIHSLQYAGSTRFDKLNLADNTHDALFIFSDGWVTQGSRYLTTATKPLFAISSSLDTDSVYLKSMVAGTGGNYINLSKHSISYAIENISGSRIQLMSVESRSGRTGFEIIPLERKNAYKIYGTISGEDTLVFTYGNHSSIYSREKLVLKPSEACNAKGIHRLGMLQTFQNPAGLSEWESVLEFGLKEKIVTMNTAYIVLERIEDYVKYNIAPPKELEEECIQKGYVTKNSKTRRQELRERDEFEIINAVVNNYNRQLQRWDPHARQIHITRLDMEEVKFSNTTAGTGNDITNLNTYLNIENSMSEVVVVGYGSNRNSITSSAFFAGQEEFRNANSIGQALMGRLPGVEVSSSPDFNDMQSIRIRGIGSISGNNQPLYVLDGIPVDGNINDLISPSEIDHITILKDASASAIYGGRAANGVIVIKSKTYQAYRNQSYKPYRLRDMEDVDYLLDIKDVPAHEKWQHYRSVELLYSDLPNFYLDMGQHFYESGMTAQALDIIMNASETSNGDRTVLRAIAYCLENWKQMDKATEIYGHLLEAEPFNLNNYQDMAWALYQSGKAKEAVEHLYKAIKLNMEASEEWWISTKISMLNDMNAMISAHADSIDFSFIPKNLVRSMPVDMQVRLSSNKGTVYDMTIHEPGGKLCSINKPVSKNGGYLGYDNYYNYQNQVYNIRKAVQGKYRISTTYYSHMDETPSMIRILVIKNYGRKDQSISVQNAIMNNQYGIVEIGEVKW